MPALRYHPSGRVLLDDAAVDPGRVDAGLRDAFARDWREGLVRLAAGARHQQGSLAARFWRLPGADYLTRVCHLDDEAREPDIPPPSDTTLTRWRRDRPPMTGGEYVTESRLREVWLAIAAWGAEAMAADGGPAAFLQKRAPAWRRVGRVAFHLAENRRDDQRPFAFLATFTTGLDAQGRPRHLPLSRALERHAGARDRAALRKLLTPVEAAARQLDWVQELVASGDIYRAKAWTPSQALRMLRSLDQLDAAGLVVRVPDWSRRPSRPTVSMTIDSRQDSPVGADAILDFDVAVTLDGERLSSHELTDLLAGEDDLVLFKGRWVEVDRGRLQEAQRHWDDLTADRQQLGFHEGLRLLSGAPADLDDGETPVPGWSEVVAGAGLRELLAGMRDPAALEPLRAGTHLNATLRPYQQEGVQWLRLLTGLGLGACLADDMGLGKTLQVLALLPCCAGAKRAGRGRPRC